MPVHMNRMNVLWFMRSLFHNHNVCVSLKLIISYTASGI